MDVDLPHMPDQAWPASLTNEQMSFHHYIKATYRRCPSMENNPPPAKLCDSNIMERLPPWRWDPWSPPSRSSSGTPPVAGLPSPSPWRSGQQCPWQPEGEGWGGWSRKRDRRGERQWKKQWVDCAEEERCYEFCDLSCFLYDFTVHKFRVTFSQPYCR